MMYKRIFSREIWKEGFKSLGKLVVSPFKFVYSTICFCIKAMYFLLKLLLIFFEYILKSIKAFTDANVQLIKIIFNKGKKDPKDRS